MRYLYTAITAGCDILRSPGPVPAGWKAVCFTDAPVHHPDWEVRLLAPASDPVRAARRIKLLAHEALPDAEVSLWMDGNFAVACDLDALVDRYLDDADLALHRHPQRDCAYEEGIACIRLGKADPEAIVRQLLRYARAGYPEHAGLPATGVVLRRHTKPVARFEQAWWDEVARGAARDQISVGVALRALDMHWSEIASDLWKGPLFQWRRHDGATTGPPASPR